MQDFCLVHVIKVEIVFFPQGIYIFWQEPMESNRLLFLARVLKNIILLLIISRGKCFFFLLLPHPSLHFSTGPSLNQLLF